MVKSYQRYEQADVFGVISTTASSIHLPKLQEFGRAHGPGQVVTGALENIAIWDVKTGELMSLLTDGLPPGAADAIMAKPAETLYLQYHSETSLLAAGYADGTIKLWDLISRTVVLKLNGHRSGISALRFDQTGTRLISGSRDSDIIIWDLVSEVGIAKLRSHKNAITGLFCIEDSYIISTSKDGLIKVWDLKTNQCIETHIAHTGECSAMSVHGDLIITTGIDSQVKIWRLELLADDGKKITEQGSFDKQSKQRGSDISFVTTPNGVGFFYIQNSDKTVEIFRIRTQEEINKALKKREKRLKEKGLSEDDIKESIKNSFSTFICHPFQVIRSSYRIKSCAWTMASNSKLELFITSSSNSIEYYSIPYKKREPISPASNRTFSVELQGHRTDIRALDISDDGKLLATASNGSLKVWNIVNKACIRTFECGYALCCKFLPGGTLVIVGTRNGELQLYDLASSTQLENMEEAHDGAIWSLDITSDGKKLVTGSADKKVKFWKFTVEQELIDADLKAYKPALKFFHDTTMEMNDDVLSVRVSPENKYLAVSLLDNTVKVFFLDSMKFFLSLYGHKLPVLSIDISFDSKIIITSSADKNIKIWGLDFGDCHKSIFAHQDSIMAVKFVPETHNFFSCSKDGVVKFWDGDKFECVQKLLAHQNEVWAITISPDGRHVISASHDHSIRVWEETDDEVFLSEEREKEMEHEYESTLLTSLEVGSGDDAFKRDDTEGDTDQAIEVHKQTMESLKSGEKLMEALDLGMNEFELFEVYEAEKKLWEKKKGPEPVKPQSNSILVAMNKKPLEYIMDVLVKIKPSQLDDALLVLPFSYVLRFLKFMDNIMKDNTLIQNHIALICKNLFFIIKTNYKELVLQRNTDLLLQITRVKDSLRQVLKLNEDELGFNIQGLKYIKYQWDLKHNYNFDEDIAKPPQDNKFITKRVFSTLT